MLSRFLYSCLVVLLLLVWIGAGPADAARKKTAKKRGPFTVSAHAAILIDENGGHRFYARAIDQQVFPASTTKIMTALIVLERKNLDDLVTISPQATQVLPSKVDLKPGEQYRIRDLLYAALLNSANDAAVALAESVAGSEEKFVDLMNRKARELGANHTLFANAHGLPSDKPQYTTAYDMCLMFRAALKKEFFSEAIKIRTMNIASREGRRISLRSHNKALFKGWKEGVYGKTGYTRAALACFVGHVQKDKRAYIVAVFGCPGATRWDDVKFIIETYGGIDL